MLAGLVTEGHSPECFRVCSEEPAAEAHKEPDVVPHLLKVQDRGAEAATDTEQSPKGNSIQHSLPLVLFSYGASIPFPWSSLRLPLPSRS